MRALGDIGAPSALVSESAAEQNKFRLVTVAFQRARQLKAGARPRVDPGNHNTVRVATLEVMAGVVSWHVEDPAPGAATSEAEPAAAVETRRSRA